MNTAANAANFPQICDQIKGDHLFAIFVQNLLALKILPGPNNHIGVEFLGEQWEQFEFAALDIKAGNNWGNCFNNDN
jgi:hypothetical protein